VETVIFGEEETLGEPEMVEEAERDQTEQRDAVCRVEAMAGEDGAADIL